jgi:thiamine biosynthesis lipoprotein
MFTGCGIQTSTGFASDEPVTGSIFAMDTVMDFSIYGEQELLDKVEERVQELESKLSVTDENSEIYAINHNGTGSVSSDTAYLIKNALQVCEKTDGALDISIYPVVRAWGFTTGEYAVPDDETINSLLSNVDYTKVDFNEDTSEVTIPSGMEIDLGSVAKGYTGDEIIALLKENGVTSALLNLGGNVQTLGSKPDGSSWRIGVQDPQSDKYILALDIENKAVITSGGYERYFEEDGETYWHIIDPATGRPARNGLISVTIIGESGLMCDSLSTSLFIMGLEKSENYWRENGGFDAVFVTDEGEILVTEGLEGRFSVPEDSGYDGEVTVIRK